MSHKKKSFQKKNLTISQTFLSLPQIITRLLCGVRTRQEVSMMNELRNQKHCVKEEKNQETHFNIV